MGKKKKKKCHICMKHSHGTIECPYMCEPCTKGDQCTKFCMVDLSTKLYKIISKLKHATKNGSYGKMERVKEKLDSFEERLDDACEYHEMHKGRKKKTCSSKKRIARLQEACDALREKYEDEFESNSSEDEDDEWGYPMGTLMSQGKGVQVEGVSQRSHQKSTDTPKPTSKIQPKGENLHHIHPNNQDDDENMCTNNVSIFNSQTLKFQPLNQI